MLCCTQRYSCVMEDLLFTRSVRNIVDSCGLRDFRPVCVKEFPKVQWQQYVGTVNKRTIVMLQISSVYCAPNIVEIDQRLLKLQYQ